MTFATADIYDERGDELDSLGLQLQDVGGHAVFDGPIRTVRCHRDNALVKSLLASPGDGAVLVIDGGGSLDSALVGDLIAGSAVENGWAGLIVHGAIRDRIAIASLPIGVRRSGRIRARAPRRVSARSTCPSRSRVSCSHPAGTCGQTSTGCSSSADAVLVER